MNDYLKIKSKHLDYEYAIEQLEQKVIHYQNKASTL